LLRDSGEKLAALSSTLGTGPDDYESYLVLEREYLRNLTKEPDDVLRTVDYMEALQRLQGAK
jgi:hypothetical protein